MERVREAMTPDPITLRTSDSLDQCRALFRHHGFRHLPIVDLRGQIAGVVTAQRVSGADEADGLSGLTQACEVTCGPDDALAPVLHRLARSHQDVAVVLDAHHHPIGVLTEHDAVRYAALFLDEALLVRHVRPRDVGAIAPDRPAHVALLQMIQERIHHLVVRDQGRMIGVVSYGDLLRAGAHHLREATVREAIRQRSVVTVDEASSVREAARVMAVHKIGCLPVLDPTGTAVRIVTRTDVLDVLAEQIERRA